VLHFLLERKPTNRRAELVIPTGYHNFKKGQACRAHVQESALNHPQTRL